jgi:hypothetical protein
MFWPAKHLEAFERALLVRSHKTRVAHHICGKDRGENNASARLIGKSLRGGDWWESPDATLALTFGDRVPASGQHTLSPVAGSI